MRLRSRAACGERPTYHRPTQEKFQSEQALTHSLSSHIGARENHTQNDLESKEGAAVRCSLTSKLRQSTAAPVDYGNLSIPTSQIPIFVGFQCKLPHDDSAKPKLTQRRPQPRTKKTLTHFMPAFPQITHSLAKLLQQAASAFLGNRCGRASTATQTRFIRPQANRRCTFKPIERGSAIPTAEHLKTGPSRERAITRPW